MGQQEMGRKFTQEIMHLHSRTYISIFCGEGERLRIAPISREGTGHHLEIVFCCWRATPKLFATL
jgi:hypothetical protein